jgi:hypothetical protein
MNVVYTLPDMSRVNVRRDIPFASELLMDVYRPPDVADDAPLPAVILVAGYPDPGFQRKLGARFKDMPFTTDWARLIAASGMVAITYTNTDPARDLDLVIDTVRHSHERIGLWASSGNVPLALAACIDPQPTWLACAALCYGYMLDVDEASRTFGFVNGTAGRTIDDIRTDLPLFLARAGQDQTPRLNESLDRFISGAIERNLPITLANHATGPHAFDLMDDSDASRTIIRQLLLFLQSHLC